MDGKVGWQGPSDEVGDRLSESEQVEEDEKGSTERYEKWT
jgi:hypothetical protein